MFRRLMVFKVVLLAIVLCSCSQSGSAPAAGSVAAPVESVRDYCPMQPGAMWKYEIEIGEVAPFISHTKLWPLKGGSQFYKIETYGEHFRSIAGRAGKKYELILRADPMSPGDVPLPSTGGVKLAVVKDDMPYYSRGVEVFLPVLEGSRFLVDEIVKYPLSSPAAPTGLTAKESVGYGFYFQTFFFDGDRSSKIGTGGGSAATLAYLGLQDGKMIFRRYFSPTAPEDSDGEQLLFEKGKGLVSFVQRKSGKISMTWRLVEFTPGK